MYKSVYACKVSGKKVEVRRIDGIDCIVRDIENNYEFKMSQSTMRKKYKYLKKESNPKRWLNNKVFIQQKEA
jgi:hypothetical protein